MKNRFIFNKYNNYGRRIRVAVPAPSTIRKQYLTRLSTTSLEAKILDKNNRNFSLAHYKNMNRNTGESDFSETDSDESAHSEGYVKDSQHYIDSKLEREEFIDEYKSRVEDLMEARRAVDKRDKSEQLSLDDLDKLDTLYNSKGDPNPEYFDNYKTNLSIKKNIDLEVQDTQDRISVLEARQKKSDIRLDECLKEEAEQERQLLQNNQTTNPKVDSKSFNPEGQTATQYVAELEAESPMDISPTDE